MVFSKRLNLIIYSSGFGLYWYLLYKLIVEIIDTSNGGSSLSKKVFLSTVLGRKLGLTFVNYIDDFMISLDVTSLCPSIDAEEITNNISKIIDTEYNDYNITKCNEFGSKGKWF